MELNKKEFQIEFAGKPLKLTISQIAEQATSAVMGQYGDTVVLVTAVMGKEDRDIDYFPLTVDYEERFYAAGKIIGSRFVRREGRPSEEAILSGRMIDRTLRPLFDGRMRRDVQIVITVLSYDETNDPDFVSLFSASTALAISEIPWQGPVAGVRLAKLKNGEFIINPSNQILGDAENIYFESFVSGTEDKINMVEFSGKEALENEVAEAFENAHSETKKLIEFQKEIVQKIGKSKADVLLAEADSDIKNKIKEFLKDKLEAAVYGKEKTEQHKKIDWSAALP